MGVELRPTYKALYMRDPPGSHVASHVDARGYELALHLVLDHTRPAAGSLGSRLVVHRAGGSEPDRLALAPGEAVLLRARGTVHAWEPLAVDEHRILIGIGYARAD